MVRYTEVFVRRGSVYRGFGQKRFVIPRFSSEEVRYIEVPTQRTTFRFHLYNYSYSLLSLLTGFLR